MATKRKKSTKPRAPPRVAIKTSLAAADIWANNAALRAQQTRENDVLRAELRNQGLEQKLMLQAMKAEVERDRLYYKRLADLGDQRATVALRDIEANSAVRVADVRPTAVGRPNADVRPTADVPPTISQSLSPEGHDSMEAYDLAGAPLTPSRGLRGILHQIAANQAETERRLRTPPQLRAQAPQPVTAAVSEQLGSVRRPMSATATPSAIRVEVNSPNPFFMSPTPPASRNASQSQKSTPHQSRASLLPVISENPRAVTQKSTGAPSLQMFVGAAR